MRQKLMAALLEANSTRLNGLAFVAMMTKGKDNDVDSDVRTAVRTSPEPSQTNPGM